jgi:hypothetical protein
MASLIEFHGRLFRIDPGPTPRGTERVAEPGRYDLRISLYATREGEDALWSELHSGVPVSVGGYFGVVLGEQRPVPPGLFDGTPRWLTAVGLGDDEGLQTARVPLLGHAIRVYEQLQGLAARVAQVEAALGLGERRVVNVNRRLRRIEHGKGILLPIRQYCDALDTRLTRLDGEEGRVTRLEDEMEDVTGTDGDLIDIIERLERMEGVGPGKASVDPKRVVELSSRVDELAERVKALARGGKK